MKQIHLLFILALFGACAGKTQDRFVLRGHVPGAMDSTRVELRSEDRSIRLSGYVMNGSFELTGEAPVAAYCRLSMNNSEVVRSKGLSEEKDIKYVEAAIFVENGNLTFRTPHIDSLPQSFWKYDIRKEKNYTLKGSASHDVYTAYALKTLDLRAELRNLERAVNRKATQEMQKTLAARERELYAIIRNYIASQNNLPVNLYLARALEMEPFTYDQAYLDGVTELFASYRDTLPALLKFRETYAKAAAYTQGTPFAGGSVYTVQGDTVELKNYVKPGRYTLLDFWASWCSPCRASFPHLRKVHKEFRDRLAFVSVSVDEKANLWRRAVKEESLPWPQLCATPLFFDRMEEMYSLYSVPTFLLIDPEGRIVFSGHSSNDLEVQLENLNL